jgi:isochorismate synthase
MNQLVDIAQKQNSIAAHWQAAVEMGYAVALWRLPCQTDKQLIVNFDDTVPTTKINLEEQPMGFAVSPFFNPEGDKTFFIESHLYFRFNTQNELIRQQHQYPEIHPIRAAFEKTVLSLSDIDTIESETHFTETDFDNREQDNYQNVVAQAVSEIEIGLMQKVVLSRRKMVVLPSNFQVVSAFDKLCKAYPNAFVSAVYLPQLNQVWLGASPETLVSLDADGIFKTVSLAGTQSAFDVNGFPIAVRNAVWTHKEIEEQAFVSRYIIDCLKKIRVREFIEEGPKTVIAGNLMHLRTDYSIDSKAIGFSQLGSVMLELLHPTSAVCGMPKSATLGFILKNENHDRSLYSGFFGPINVDNESALFVNLRCMKIESNIATLYAGAGITEDSIPEKEWQETELKCQTLLRVLG